MWSMRKQLHVAALLALSVGLFYLAFTIDRVDGKMFEHSSVVKLDANNFDEKVGHRPYSCCHPASPHSMV